MHESVQRLIEVATGFGGKITKTDEVDAGWISECSFGSPIIKVNGKTTRDPVNFSITFLHFPQPIDFGLLLDEMKIERYWTLGFNKEKLVSRMEVFDHPNLTPIFGYFQTGIVIATTAIKMTDTWERKGSHLTLTPNGIVERLFG